MGKKEKQEAGLFGTPIDARTALSAAQLGSNVLPGGQLVNVGLDMAGASLDVDDCIKQSLALTGEEDVRNLQAGSAAFKNYIKKSLPEIYGDRAIGLGFSLAGGAIALGTVGMVFGLPAGILGMVVGAGVGIGGTMVAGFVKDALFPSTYNSFLSFASELQNQGQQKQLSPEAAFVALVVNMPDEASKKRIFASLPKYTRVTDDKGLIKLLGREEGREMLRQVMVLHDGDVRPLIGAMSISPRVTISEHLAGLVNNGQIAGIDLFHSHKMGTIGNLIALREMQDMQATPLPTPPATTQNRNPNQHLPYMQTGRLPAVHN